MLQEEIIPLMARLDVHAAPASEVEEIRVAVEERVVGPDVHEGATLVAEQTVEEDVFHILCVRDAMDYTNGLDGIIDHHGHSFESGSIPFLVRTLTRAQPTFMRSSCESPTTERLFGPR